MGPGRSAASQRSSPSLLAQLGGREAVRGVVTELYRRLLGDPVVAPTFVGYDVERITGHVVDFLVAALGGRYAYRGRDLAAAHAGLAITHESFDRVATHLADVIKEFGKDPDLAELVLERVGPMRPFVVTRSYALLAGSATGDDAVHLESSTREGP